MAESTTKKDAVKKSTLPVTLRLMAGIHVVCLILLCLSTAVLCEVNVGRKLCSAMPASLTGLCACSEDDADGVKVICKGLNSTAAFKVPEEESGEEDHNRPANAIDGGESSGEMANSWRRALSEVTLRESDVRELRLSDFADLRNLRELSVTNAGVRTVIAARLPQLTGLDLSGNAIVEMGESLLASLPQLRRLNVSRNNLANLPEEAFEGTPRLATLDLSRNNLTNDLHTSSLQSLPSTLGRLDLSSE